MGKCMKITNKDLKRLHEERNMYKIAYRNKITILEYYLVSSGHSTLITRINSQEVTISEFTPSLGVGEIMGFGDNFYRITGAQTNFTKNDPEFECDTHVTITRKIFMENI